MYSTILTLALTASGPTPDAHLLHRSGCSGVSAVATAPRAGCTGGSAFHRVSRTRIVTRETVAPAKVAPVAVVPAPAVAVKVTATVPLPMTAAVQASPPRLAPIGGFSMFADRTRAVFRGVVRGGCPTGNCPR